MATQAQMLANLKNALLSTGAKTIAGKQASSRNNTKHGLAAKHQSGTFYLMVDENQAEYLALRERLEEEHQPQTETERILVRRMAESDWLRTRALRFQNACFQPDQHVLANEHLALYIRYQANHERAFSNALKELRTLREQRAKQQIGFESQKRTVELHQLKVEALKLKNERLKPPPRGENTQSEAQKPIASPDEPRPNPDSSPGGLAKTA